MDSSSSPLPNDPNKMRGQISPVRNSIVHNAAAKQGLMNSDDPLCIAPKLPTRGAELRSRRGAVARIEKDTDSEGSVAEVSCTAVAFQRQRRREEGSSSAPVSFDPSDVARARTQATTSTLRSSLLSVPTSRQSYEFQNVDFCPPEVNTKLCKISQEKFVRFSPRSPLQRSESCRCRGFAQFGYPQPHSLKSQASSVVVDLANDSDTSGAQSSLEAPQLEIPVCSPIQGTRYSGTRKFVVLSSDEDLDAENVEEADTLSSPKKRKTSPEQIRQRRSARLLNLSHKEETNRAQCESAVKIKEGVKRAPLKRPASGKASRTASGGISKKQGEDRQTSCEIAVPLKQECVQNGDAEAIYRDSCVSYSRTRAEDADAARKVKDTLRLFNSYYLRYVQEEEARCRKEANEKDSLHSSNTKKRRSDDEFAYRKKSRRPDLKAIKQMKEEKTVLHTTKVIGHVPGIAVGDQFFSRCEMSAIGLHDHWLAGIDYLGASQKKFSHKFRLPVAISLVLSGAYEDDVDNSDDVVYTGQGGNDLLGNKRQIADQIMERGNLALKNCMDQDVTVRLVRGHKTKKSYTGKVYTYDGLYKVKDFWAEKGISGFTVFKFRLQRVEGQPLLTTDQVHFVRGQVPTNTTELRGMVCLDLSGGLENIPVPASNVIDDPPFAPTDFEYIAEVMVDKNVPKPLPAIGCKCKGDCLDASKCACAILNRKKFPYVTKNGGRLVEPVDVVYECGSQCGCGPSCSNRVSQRGLYYRLEVFRTATKGWGVRSWDHIPAGAPVCEYVGLLMKTEDADGIRGNDFIFELDCLQTMKEIGGRQRRDLSEAKNDCDEVANDDDQQPEYCINAGNCGNVSRFINHSCEPNLFVQCVLNTHHDLSQPRIILFASENIHPLQELTYDYGYELGSVVVNGQVKVLPCYCGVYGCRKRLY